MRQIVLVFLGLLLVVRAFTQNSTLAKQASELAEIDYNVDGNIQSSIDNYIKAILYEEKTEEADSSFIGVCNFYIGFLYAQVGNIKAAETYYKIAEEITTKIKNKEAQEVVFRSLGKLYMNGNYTEALKYYQKAYEFAVDLGNIFEQEVCLSDIGLIYYYTGKHKKALDNFNTALELTKRLENNPEEPVTITNNIGLVYYSAGEYQKAISYFNKAIELHDSINLTSSLTMQLINIATCYNYLGDQEKSIEYYNKAISDTKEREDETEEAMVRAALGLAYYQWGLYDLALESHNKSLIVYENLNLPVAIARCKSNIALVYLIQSDHEKANNYFKEALEITQASGDVMGTATILNHLGEGNRNLGYYEKALQRYNESLDISLDAGLQQPEAISLNGIGLIYSEKGDFLLSIEYFERALKYFYSAGNNDNVAAALNNIGMAYQSMGQYDKAITKFNEAYNFSVTAGSLYNQALTQNNIGMTYFYWGRYQDALNYYNQAQMFSKKNSIKKIEAISYNNIGLVYYNLGKYNLADSCYKEAYAISLEIDDKKNQARVLNNFGLIFFSEYDLSRALNHFSKSLQIYEELELENIPPVLYNNLGQIYYWRDSYDTALIYFDKSLHIAKQTNDMYSEARVLNSIGNLYNGLADYKNAAVSYEASLTLNEQLRETADGDIKRDYLAESLFIYNNLISNYIDYEEYNKAFKVNEKSKARYLLEQLGVDETWRTKFGYENTTVPAQSLVISFANTNWSNKIVFTMKQNDTLINAIQISDTIFFKHDLSDESFYNNLAYLPKRGATVLVNDEDKKELLKGLVEDEDFDEIINYYRLLLSNPIASNKKNIEKIGNALYDYLIKPIEAELAGIENIIIVPDGALSNIPFECLIDENGHYLAEKYTIQYTPSLSVLNYLEGRTYQNRDFEVLAIGNPEYDNNFNKNDTIATREELLAFRKRAGYSISQNEPLGQYYGDLGYGYWESLDGTEKEIYEISHTFDNAETLTGELASEKSIRDLSNSGELKDYNIIHFATHGVTIPRAPELSALVLTQIESDTIDDGYLTMGEIANLKMEADFVNLSACETGLGKIYGGEGVVGLTQAFLVAGANGLSVSLWQVGDESTALFMTELYKLVESSNISYPKAITEIKRRFIQGEYGDKYTQPFYWGPFVYYGKE